LGNQIDLDKQELITIYLRPEERVRSEVIATVELFKSSVFARTISFLKYLIITNRANYLISALNTNAIIAMHLKSDKSYYLSETWTAYIYHTNNLLELGLKSCEGINRTQPAVFLSILNNTDSLVHRYWNGKRIPESETIDDISKATNVSGFFGGCIPLDALLPSTLDCLYDIKCIELLINYFPGLNQVCMTLYYLSSIFSLSRRTLSGPTLFCHQSNKMFLWAVIYLIFSLKNGQQK
jgi:hypothetical protein